MQQAKSHYLSIILYVLGFLLFWEWLRPLSVISNTGNIDYFVGFAAFSFILSYLRFPFWITFPVKLLAVFYALHLLYFYNSTFFNTLWMEYFWNDLKENLIFTFDGNWVGLTNLFRSFLFFILLWIISYLMRYWLLQARKLFLFFFVTVIYLTVLDTYTLYHADKAIVRTMIIGLILLGLLRVIRIQEKEKVSFDRSKLPITWLIGLAVMIALTATVGYAAPKIGPQWPDPVPFIQKAANGYEEYGSNSGQGKGTENGNGMQKIGYDDDDTQLGGGFVMDDTPVFYTTGTYSHYWRVSTKNYYTGKGWVTKPKGDSVTVNAADLSKQDVLDLYGENTSVKKATDAVEYLGDSFPQLIYGDEVTAIKDMNQNNTELKLNTLSGKFEPLYHGRHITLKKYSLSYDYPTFSIPKLREVEGNGKDPQEIKDTYLQLPNELPQRVKDLAADLTKSSANRYDKAQAILNYLKGTAYTYQTDNVAKPTGRTDYVDQFLFDTKVGYCDNFSTSMAVLLRAADIPARWVKGFNQGTYKDKVDDDKYQYVVKNSDAHSWVEVYFPGSGWVPFEPTKSFDNLYSFNYSDSTSDAKTTSTAPAKTEEKKPDNKQRTQNLPHDKKKDTTGNGFSWHLSFSVVWKGIIGLVITLVIITISLIFTRKKWLPGYILRKYSKKNDDDTLASAFKQLIKLLDLFGYEKRPEQTLREYASRVDRSLGINDMKKLIAVYEQNLYYHSATNKWSDCKESWENIINKLRG